MSSESNALLRCFADAEKRGKQRERILGRSLGISVEWYTTPSPDAKKRKTPNAAEYACLCRCQQGTWEHFLAEMLQLEKTDERY
jgi:hypothetical protein